MDSPSASAVPGPDKDPGFTPAGSPAGSLAEPGRWVPVITRPDPMPPGEWEALLAAGVDEAEPPGDGEEHLDPEGSVLPWDEDLAVIEDETARIAAERFADARYLARAETAELAGASAASAARKRGPRGPGLPGSANRIPGVSGGPAGGFGFGECLDLAPGSAALLGFIETAVDSGRLGAAPEDEIIGLITAADRAEAAACSLKHAAAAELIRRRPAPGCTLLGPSRMPEAYLDSAGDEVKWALAESRHAADGVLSLAWDLEVKLPGTGALFRDGFLRHSRARIIARETALLDPGEARQAEALVLGRARTLSPAALRSADPNPAAARPGGPAPDRRAGPARDSPSPPPDPGRPADTAPGGSPPGHPASPPGSSRSTPSPPGPATTATRPKDTTPGSSSGT